MGKSNDDFATSPHFDIKAEVLAARLIGTEFEGESLPIDRVLMAPSGDHKRRSGRRCSGSKTQIFRERNCASI